MLRLLEPFEINQVLADNFSIWSPGLDRTRYRHYQWWQFKTPWGRRHLQYYGHFEEAGKLAASCKRYDFEWAARTKTYRIAGIGAVFVPQRNRGKSYGLEMLKEMAELCGAEGYDAIFLNSDIDPAYYAKLGYHLFDASSFSIKTTDEWLASAIKELDSLVDNSLDESFSIRSVVDADFAEMCRHHKRWLRDRNYGLIRSEDYWRYKVGRELYLFQNSRLRWPKMDIMTDNYGEFNSGYALFEQAGEYLRVLEVIGKESVRNSLWAQILRLAKRRKIATLRGWKVMAPPLKHLNFSKRDWSFPMICPLKEEHAEEMISWTKQHPPNMLELDHF